jgi:hypothetical protein
MDPQENILGGKNNWMQFSHQTNYIVSDIVHNRLEPITKPKEALASSCVE